MNYYTQNAQALCSQYNNLEPEELHHPWLCFLRAKPGLACDVGAGTGRDAAWLATKSWEVIAVEPNSALRTLGQQYTSESPQGSAATWLDDSLPDLEVLRSRNLRFHLILLSAVWMHMPPVQHERAMRILSDLLAPGGLLVITLRHGPDEEGRFYPVCADDVIRLAEADGLTTKICTRTSDLRRPDIEWDTLAFILPNQDGSAV